MHHSYAGANQRATTNPEKDARQPGAPPRPAPDWSVHGGNRWETAGLVRRIGAVSFAVWLGLTHLRNAKNGYTRVRNRTLLAYLNARAGQPCFTRTGIEVPNAAAHLKRTITLQALKRCLARLRKHGFLVSCTGKSGESFRRVFGAYYFDATLHASVVRLPKTVVTKLSEPSKRGGARPGAGRKRKSKGAPFLNSNGGPSNSNGGPDYSNMGPPPSIFLPESTCEIEVFRDADSLGSVSRSQNSSSEKKKNTSRSGSRLFSSKIQNGEDVHQTLPPPSTIPSVIEETSPPPSSPLVLDQPSEPVDVSALSEEEKKRAATSVEDAFNARRSRQNLPPRGVHLGRVDFPRLTPDVLPQLQVPPPPRIIRGMSDREVVWMLLTAYRAAVAKHTGKPCYAYARGAIPRKLLLEAAAVFENMGVAPAAWAVHSVRAWYEKLENERDPDDTRKRPSPIPPLGFVFATMRIANRWGFDETSACPRRSMLSSTHRSIFARLQQARALVLQRKASIEVALNKFFPNGFEREVAGAVSSVEVEQRELDERVARGEIVW